jgi:hypothetical protein
VWGPAHINRGVLEGGARGDSLALNQTPWFRRRDVCGVCVRGAKLKPDLGPRSRKPPDLQIAAAIYFGRRVDNFLRLCWTAFKTSPLRVKVKGHPNPNTRRAWPTRDKNKWRGVKRDAPGQKRYKNVSFANQPP